MKMTMRSSLGSTQNAVLAAPPQAYPPGVPRVCARAGDCRHYLPCGGNFLTTRGRSLPMVTALPRKKTTCLNNCCA